MSIASIRQNILLLAEAFDAWRVVPRLMIVAYGYLVFNLYIWYKNIPTYVEEKCDANVITVLLAKGMSSPEIKNFACTVVDVVGGPTAAQSTFVTTIIGLSTGIFGLYTATGRKWDGWEPNLIGKNVQVSYQPTPMGPQIVTPVQQPNGDVILTPVQQEKDKTTIQIFANQQGDKATPATPAPEVTSPAETAVVAPEIEYTEAEPDHPPTSDSPAP